MQYKRWYDKNIYLKQIIEFMESCSGEIRNELANDIIQLAVENQYDVDSFICDVNNNIPEIRHRWYDKDETTCSAVEMLRSIDEAQRNDILIEILSMLNADSRYFQEKD